MLFIILFGGADRGCGRAAVAGCSGDGVVDVVVVVALLLMVVEVVVVLVVVDVDKMVVMTIFVVVRHMK